MRTRKCPANAPRNGLATDVRPVRQPPKHGRHSRLDRPRQPIEFACRARRWSPSPLSHPVAPSYAALPRMSIVFRHVDKPVFLSPSDPSVGTPPLVRTRHLPWGADHGQAMCRKYRNHRNRETLAAARGSHRTKGPCYAVRTGQRPVPRGSTRARGRCTRFSHVPNPPMAAVFGESQVLRRR